MCRVKIILMHAASCVYHISASFRNLYQSSHSSRVAVSGSIPSPSSSSHRAASVAIASMQSLQPGVVGQHLMFSPSQPFAALQLVEHSGTASVCPAGCDRGQRKPPTYWEPWGGSVARVRDSDTTVRNKCDKLLIWPLI